MQSRAYSDLEQHFRKLSNLQGIESVLHWDLATVMPSGGSQVRGDQIAELRGIRHNLITDTKLSDLINEAENDKSLDEWQRANIQEMRKKWIVATSLTNDLVIALSKAEITCEAAWRDAHSKANFKIVLPYLEKLVPLIREAALAKADRLNLNVYDALLNDFEPGCRSEEISDLFQKLESFLPALLDEVIDLQKYKRFVAPEGPFPAGKQRELGIQLMHAFGFDFNHGRLDVSRHPFCGGVPDDIRITTRFDPNDFTSSLMGILHETGHALYEKGLPKNWRFQPVGEPLGMAIHESQSLLIEMQVCRSRDFIHFLAPIAKDIFGGTGAAWKAENLYRIYTEVKRSLIRVDADEISYPLHIILRFQLEKALIEDNLKIADLPSAWNEKFKKLLGLDVPNDKLGCLQDIHWYDGAWGYFPTYTIGALAAAQLFQSAKTQSPNILNGIKKGQFGPLISWLGINIHSKGRVFPAEELIKNITGCNLDTSFFENHIRQRYLN